MARPGRSLEAAVVRRARGLCEYCHFPASAAELPFHVDHISAPLSSTTGRLDRALRVDNIWLRGKTAVGRTTIAVLAMNSADSIAVREALRDEDIFNP